MVCVAWMFAVAEFVVEFVTVVPPVAFVVVFVTVCALAGVVWVLVAPETALLACFATLDTAELAAPEPHPLRAGVAIRSAAAPSASGLRSERERHMLPG